MKYGTEGTGVTSVSRIGRVKFGAVGQPLTGLEVKIAEDGEVTPTMKVKRKFVNEAFCELIDNMY